MKKPRVGIIGAGNMGKNHARVYSEIAEIGAIADVFEEVGKPLAQRYNVNFYHNYQEMLEKEKLDAVSVVVPTQQHTQVTLHCLMRKIPTLVEKPITATLKEARLLLRESVKRKTFLMVGHIERFNPAVIKLKEIIKLGRLGKIISLLSMRVGINPPRTSNSDVALDMAIHDVDVFNYLLEAFPKRKRIIRTKLFSKNIADSATVLLEYGSITGIIQTNWITPIKTRRLFLSATDGYAELDYINQKLILYDKLLETKFDGSFYELVSISNNSKKEVYVSKREPLKEELQFFLKNKHDYRNTTNLNYAINALKIIL